MVWLMVQVRLSCLLSLPLYSSNFAGAVGDPAALGVSAVLLGKTEPQYVVGAWSEREYIVNKAPRWWNGAISQRADVPELW